MSTNPLAPNPETNIDNPGVLEPDYNEPIEDPDSGELPDPDEEDDEETDEDDDQAIDEKLPLTQRL